MRHHASESERRGPRPITEWQVVRLHPLAPPPEQPGPFGPAAADGGKMSSWTPSLKPEWRGSGLLIRRQADRYRRRSPLTTRRTSAPSGKGSGLLSRWRKPSSVRVRPGSPVRPSSRPSSAGAANGASQASVAQRQRQCVEDASSGSSNLPRRTKFSAIRDAGHNGPTARAE